ncbi:MAG: mRNA surveillance protein pelota [Candidatus Korarchaeota archaeon]|nr:mRNA surveillance protein pelota [Candidatus Korarchaeota archaeon]NIU83959.1 mRNA surveillance protein pelota [Candidatus Thorarchaeota archaeon]NIW14087.1 mRNA surveillance protein pelota [Candidatus Thorarchaeota archaeon]NIW52197.1 mRNA surveillance protein pelota [Candidatus Korarchaeota archaeon]
MEILQLDRGQGRLQIKVEGHEDFFVLSRFLKDGDLITSKTTRKIKRENKVFRKSMVVTLRFTETSYQSFGKRLRISGIIQEGPEDLVSRGSYHTINVEINDILELRREDLTKEDIDQLRKAEKYTKMPPLLLVAIERGVATVGLLSSYELKVIRSLAREVSTKGVEGSKSLLHKFFSEVFSIMRQYLDTSKAVIVAGPGFTKKKFSKFLADKIPNEKVYTGNISTGTRSGLHEIVRRGLPEKIQKDQRISEETRLIGDLLKHIGKEDGLAVYGYDEVKRAITYGAVDTLLISDSTFYSKKMRDEIMKMIEQTRDMGGSFRIISSLHPSGKQFEQMGGLGALLRYKLR